MNWDHWFLGLAEYISSASKDPSTHVGAVIVRPDRTVASIGYNGFPRGVKDYPSRYMNRELKYQMAVHAEANAILTAREPLHDYTVYTIPFAPCAACAGMIIQAGITRVVTAPTPRELAARWDGSLVATRLMFQEAQVQLDIIGGTE